MEILRTKNYDAFKCITSNREVDPAHVRKLVDSIRQKNLMNINPIIVDSDMNVIDGQHRLEACRSLDIDAHYVISAGVKKEDLKLLNSVQKSWSLMDFINYFTVEGRKEFVDLSNFINKFPEFGISSLLHLVCKDARDNNIKEGYLKCENLAEGEALALKLRALRNKGFDFVYQRNFIIAFKKVVSAEYFDFDLLLKKIDAQPRSFCRCPNKEEYLRMVEEIYNRYQQKNLLNVTSRKAA
jgi:hypothetical protein